MAYAVQADLTAAITAGGLTLLSDLDNSATDTTALGEALLWGQSLIDAYATGTPGATEDTAGGLWETTPERATQVNVTLAIYRLYQTIWGEVPAVWQAEYDKALQELKDLAAGRVSWVATEDAPAQVQGTVYYFNAGSTARTANPRRTRRSSLDLV